MKHPEILAKLSLEQNVPCSRVETTRYKEQAHRSAVFLCGLSCGLVCYYRLMIEFEISSTTVSCL